MRRIIPLLAIAIAPAAGARGLATDLRPLQAAATQALGKGTIARAAPERLTLACSGCRGAPMVDLLTGRQDDGTEQRVRSGATGMADLERACRQRSPTCRITALTVAPAVGWVSSYPIGKLAGATAVILRDGAMLTIRAMADDSASARAAVDRLLPIVRAQAIGR